VARIVLIHWRPPEAASNAAALRRAGHTVTISAPQGAVALRAFRASPPDLFVIDLTRLPSQGRDAGLFLRHQKPTRFVPLVFAGGAPDKISHVKETLPDAVFCSWRAVQTAVRKALSRPVERPAIPGVLAGYSGTPLPKKLGIKSGLSVALLGAPADFPQTLGALPGDVNLIDRPGRPADLIVLFIRSRADLDRRLPPAIRAMRDGGGLWIVWPKKASGIVTDVSETVVRATGLAAGIVDYKIASVDATWSGLKFARRRAP
jgi:hypothetical protein